jgi:replicative DNA helicase
MAITANTKILTHDYWKPASQLDVGDYVFDRKGKLVRVTMAQQYHSAECYEVMFNDYLSITGDSKLALPTENHKYRTRLHTYKCKRKFLRPLRPMTTEQLLTTPLLDHRNRKTISVPTADPLHLPHRDLPVPPFLFGFWFFARRSTGNLAPARDTSELVHQKFKDHGYKVTTHAKMITGELDFSTIPTIHSQLIPSIPKQISNNYLLASDEQRWDLLSGIVCAKNRQYNKKEDKFRVTSTNYETVRRVQLLAETLGCKTKLQTDHIVGNHTVWFKTKVKIHPDQSSPPLKVHYGRRYITKISPIPAQLCVHIETDGEDGTILAGEGFIPCL